MALTWSGPLPAYGPVRLCPFSKVDLNRCAIASRDRHRRLHGRAARAGSRFGRRGAAGLTQFAWTDPSLHRVELYIEPWNTASVRTAEHCGYLCEVLLPGHLEIRGQRRDPLRFAATRPV